MKHQISRISILQTSKIVTVLYVAIGFILVPIGCIMVLLPAPTNNPALRITGFIYLFGPVVYGVIGFIFTVIGAWLYNLVAARIGGIEFELKEISSPPPAS